MEQNTHFSKSQCCHFHFVATSTKIDIFQKLYLTVKSLNTYYQIFETKSHIPMVAGSHIESGII